MSITGIIMAAVIVGGTGLFIGIFLGLTSSISLFIAFSTSFE